MAWQPGHERILVWITPHLNVTAAVAMIASGRRNAERFHGEFYVAYLDQPDLAPTERAALDEIRGYARDAGAHVEGLDGEDEVDAVMDFARAHGITQIFAGHTTQEGLWEHVLGSPLDRLIRAAEGIDVRVFPQSPRQ